MSSSEEEQIYSIALTMVPGIGHHCQGETSDRQNE